LFPTPSSIAPTKPFPPPLFRERNCPPAPI
jgi:hypothetical protein